jgi:hypothetical protein
MALIFLTLFVVKEVGSSSTGSLVSQEALNVARALSTAAADEPSLPGLQAQISDLEQELRNTEFRLQFMFNQRAATLELIQSAKRLVEKLEKA